MTTGCLFEQPGNRQQRCGQQEPAGQKRTVLLLALSSHFRFPTLGTGISPHEPLIREDVGKTATLAKPGVASLRTEEAGDSHRVRVFFPPSVQIATVKVEQ